MGTTPEPEIYRPPPASAGDISEWTVPLTDNDYLFVRQHVYRGKIVDFAIMQYHRVEDSRYALARIDCCHGAVHRHAFDRAGTDLIDSQPIQVIPAEGGRDTVDPLFNECYQRMMNDYEANLRRWWQT